MKTIKKILSVISAATICTVPILSSSVVNAAPSGQYDTYAIYCDVPANSGVMWANLEFVYKDMEEIKSHVGDFGGTVSDASGARRPNGEQSFAACFRANGALSAPGNLFTTKLITENGYTVKDIYTTSFDAKRNLITNNPVTFDVVLVGDANGNGVVTVADATAIRQYVGNPSTYGISNLRAADVNFDGVVDLKDAELIQMYDARVIDCF